MRPEADRTETVQGQAAQSGVSDPSAVAPKADVASGEEHFALTLARQLVEESRVRTHYYVKVGVSAFLCALLLLIGVPVFMESRVTGSLSYTALGVVLVGFGLILAVAVIVLLFRPPFDK